jgi:hypothetical protein
LIADIRQEVLAQGLVAEIDGATNRSWIFPRDPLFLGLFALIFKFSD